MAPAGDRHRTACVPEDAARLDCFLHERWRTSGLTTVPVPMVLQAIQPALNTTIPPRSPSLLSKPLAHGLLIANIVCTILVVSVHYASGERSDFIEEIFRNGFARVASPFFALIAGFFLYRELSHFDAYVDNVRKRARSILLPYAIATVGIASFLLVREIAARGMPANLDVPGTLLGSIIDPASVQLWFLRDVIIMAVLSYFLRTRIFWVDAAVVAVLGVFWMLDFQPMPLLGRYYLVSIDVLFFFLLGGLLSSHPRPLEAIVKLPAAPLALVTALWAGLVFTRAVIDPTFDRWYVRAFTPESLFLYKSAILVGLVPLIGWSSRVRSERFKGLKKYTFFIYLFHLEPIQFVLYHGVGRFIDKGLYFYVLFPLAFLAALASAMLLSRFLPSVYAVISGGRGGRRGEKADVLGVPVVSQTQVRPG
jgi:surface polysaccharide O-acyltransferase-like enzyme